MTMTISMVNENHDISQPIYPCPCCRYDCGDTNCILCDYCNNWFHQSCAKISEKRFDYLKQSSNYKFKCKFCIMKKQNCFECNKLFSHHRNKKLYCITCNDWFCSDCLRLPKTKIKEYMTTDLPYFCRDCSLDHYCPICYGICRDKVLFCQCCEKFIHAKCTKLTRGQIRSQGHNYICNICIKDNLPMCSTASTNDISKKPSSSCSDSNDILPPNPNNINIIHTGAVPMRRDVIFVSNVTMNALIAISVQIYREFVVLAFHVKTMM